MSRQMMINCVKRRGALTRTRERSERRCLARERRVGFDFLSGRTALGSENSADCWSSDLGLALFPTL